MESQALNKKLISIIVVCYNQSQYLVHALESVFNQTYQQWECLIIDDGSTDETELIATQYIKKDSRFKYYKKINGGVSSARNLGLKNINGDYIQFLDADDWIEATMIDKCYPNKNQELTICGVKTYNQNEAKSEKYYCDISSTKLSFDNIVRNWGYDFDIPIHSGLISSQLLKNFLFDENLKVSEDWLMWLHIFYQQPIFSIVKDELVTYRKWEKSATTDLNSTMYNNFYAYIHAVKVFNLDKDTMEYLTTKAFERLFERNTFLEESLFAIKSSTSFRLSYIVVSKIKLIQNRFFKTKSV